MMADFVGCLLDSQRKPISGLKNAAHNLEIVFRAYESKGVPLKYRHYSIAYKSRQSPVQGKTGEFEMAHNYQNEFDIIIIGSGAGGGILAYALKDTNARILIVERGDYIPQEGWFKKAQ
jgi:hypothetical protein